MRIIVRLAALTLAVLMLMAAAGCANGQPAEQDGTSGGGAPYPEPGAGGGPAYAWLDIELTDAVTGEKYTVADFAGDPVMLHAFAVW
ncbi:MAG: hypothetical protein QMC79_08035 [Anaerosomatales bacterium]|nr:hypothetical protein [Anaerosomatales bacterium]